MWTYGSIRIYVQDFDEGAKAIIARLQPLGGGTVLHHFGYEDQIYKVAALVVGSTNKDALIAFAQDQAAHDLVTPFTTVSGLYANSVSAKLTPTAYQTIDEAQDCYAPVYRVDMELYHA